MTATETTWEQLPGEPNLWYDRFHHYCLAGSGRSFEQTWRHFCPRPGQQEVTEGNNRRLRQPPATFYAMARDWRWQARAAAYDEHERRQAREARAKAIEEMNQRHGLLARALFNKIAVGLHQADPTKFSPDQLMRGARDSIALERLALGQPIVYERHEHTGPGGGAMGTVHANYFQPDARAVAEVIRELERHDALGAPPEDEGEDTPPGPRLVSA